MAAAPGDDAVFWCAGIALCGGFVATASAAYACTNQVLMHFAPKIAWVLFAPSLLAVLLGAVGLSASRRPVSKLLRVQLASFVLLSAVVLAGAGAFVSVAAGTTSQWILDGCEDFRVTGLWTQARRVEAKLRAAHEQYKELHCGWERCRGFNGMVYDLSACGVRARCEDRGRISTEVPMYGWFHHEQVALACGGFCRDAVPLFGPTSMLETMLTKPACAERASENLESVGKTLGAIAGLVALPLIVAALALFCAASDSEEGFQELDSSDPDEMERSSQLLE